MKKVPLSEIAEGMVLARDVLDRGGHVLLGGGTVLTGRHCATLRNQIEGEIAIAESPADTESPAAAGGGGTDPRVQKRLERVEHMFSDVRGDPLMEEILRLARERAAKGVARG